MLVTNLEKMENLVSSSKDLGWSGWDVVKYRKGLGAQFDSSGVFKDGGWFYTKTYILKESGWSIPRHVLGNYE